MIRVPATHPHWNGFLLLSEDDDKIIHEGTGSTGRYQRQGDRLVLRWDKFDPEAYLLVSGCYIQETLAKGMPNANNVLMVTLGRQMLRATKLSVLVPEYNYEVTLRVGTSDVPTFEQVFTNREYESANLPEAAEGIVDLGANIGLASAYFALRYPKARILAVEPEAENFMMLQANTQALGGRVVPVLGAVWKEDGSTNLHTEDDAGRPMGAWGVQVSDAQSAAARTIDCYRLDTLLKISGFEHVDILKIDIEGAELELFTYSAEAWLDRAKLIAVETHDRFRPGSEAAVRDALADSFEELPQVGENLFFRRRGA